jgi:hypothetical protein
MEAEQSSEKIGGGVQEKIVKKVLCHWTMRRRHPE